MGFAVLVVVVGGGRLEEEEGSGFMGPFWEERRCGEVRRAVSRGGSWGAVLFEVVRPRTTLFWFGGE